MFPSQSRHMLKGKKEDLLDTIDEEDDVTKQLKPVQGQKLNYEVMT